MPDELQLPAKAVASLLVQILGRVPYEDAALARSVALGADRVYCHGGKPGDLFPIYGGRGLCPIRGGKPGDLLPIHGERGLCPTHGEKTGDVVLQGTVCAHFGRCAHS